MTIEEYQATRCAEQRHMLFDLDQDSNPFGFAPGPDSDEEIHLFAMPVPQETERAEG
jgi:hypothetical protein